MHCFIYKLLWNWFWFQP